MEEITKRNSCDEGTGHKKKKQKGEDQNNEDEIVCNKRFVCESCSQTFSRSSNLRRHISRLHDGDKKLINDTISGNGLCLECNRKFRQASHLRGHLINEHGFPDEQQNLTFSNKQEFEAWKKEMEEKTLSLYVKSAKITGVRSFYYICNRSGMYKSKVKGETRQRKAKKGGTLKTNMLCTSTIRYSVNSEDGIEVKFFPTHYGHDMRKVAEKSPKPKRKYTKRKQNVETTGNDDSYTEQCTLELDDERELTKDLSVIKRQISSTLWEISCDVERCSSKETLSQLNDRLKVIRESTFND